MGRRRKGSYNEENEIKILKQITSRLVRKVFASFSQFYSEKVLMDGYMCSPELVSKRYEENKPISFMEIFFDFPPGTVVEDYRHLVSCLYSAVCEEIIADNTEIWRSDTLDIRNFSDLQEVVEWVNISPHSAFLILRIFWLNRAADYSSRYEYGSGNLLNEIFAHVKGSMARLWREIWGFLDGMEKVFDKFPPSCGIEKKKMITLMLLVFALTSERSLRELSFGSVN